MKLLLSTAAYFPVFPTSHLAILFTGLKMAIINTFAASYLNTQGLNNLCLKSRQLRP